MARILIFSQDAKLSESLALRLRMRRHEIAVNHCPGGLLREGEDQLMPYDILVLDVTGKDYGATKKLIAMRSEMVHRGVMPIVLCTSRIYKGSQFELDIERQGARLIYVR